MMIKKPRIEAHIMQQPPGQVEVEDHQDVVPPLNVGDAPVFYPTELEFKDPLKYVESIYENAEKYGICKVVPPSSWNPPFCMDPDTFEFCPRVQSLRLIEAKQRLWQAFRYKLTHFWSMYTMKINYPIVIKDVQLDLPTFNYMLMDTIHAAGGLKLISMDSWKNITTKLGFAHFDMQLASDLQYLYETLISPMERFANSVNFKVKQYVQRVLSNPAKLATRKRKATTRTPKNMMKAASHETTYNIASGFDFGQLNVAILDSEGFCCKCSTRPVEFGAKITCMVCESIFHEMCLEPCPTKTSFLSSSRSSFKCTGCCALVLYTDPLLAFGFKDHNRTFRLADFECYSEVFKKMYFDVDDSTKIPERVVEKEFWKLVLNSKQQMVVFYGADLQSKEVGSGFPLKKIQKLDTQAQGGVQMENEADYEQYRDSGWNLNNFPKLDASVLRHIGSNVSGMTDPWIYIGMLFSAFCWHTEDHWSASINYLHLGSTKSWYGVPGSQAADVDRRIKQYVPSLFRLQPNVMHNLNTMIYPNELVNAGIRVSRVDQRPGEFVITFPRAYHAGFNHGFNCAEAVNFATSRWLRFGYDSIGHYITIKRNHVFSHEELIVKMASNPAALGLEEAKEIYVQLREEKELLVQLKELGVKARRRVKLEEITNDDERTCFFCHRTLFFSMISCGCLSNHAILKMRQSCPKHFRTLCPCALAKRKFMYRFTSKELMELDVKLYARISESTIAKYAPVVGSNDLDGTCD